MTFSPETIDQWLSSYPQEWGKKIPDLDEIGRRIRNRTEPYATLGEVREIIDWKWRGAGSEFEKLNSMTQVVETTRKALAKTSAEDVVEELRHMGQVRTPMASAILRFVCPDKFGTVDWRNLYVLSHSSNEYGRPNALFETPVMKVSDDRKEIPPARYVSYLWVIRKIAQTHPSRTEKAERLFILKELRDEFHSRTVAEVDMAIFSYSWHFIK